MAYIGSREILPDMWPATGERKGVFVNFARTSAPTVRPDGSALQEGDAYYLTTDDLFYLYSGSAWAAISSGTSTLNAAYLGGNQTITRSGDPVTVNDALTDATHTISINKTAAGSGNLIDINATGAMTGDFINLTLTNAATAAQALVIESQAALRVTNALVQIDENGTGAVPTVNIAGDAATTGPLLRVNASAAVAPVAGTDGMVTVNLTNSAAASEGILLVAPAGQTGAALGITSASTTTGPLIRLVNTGAGSGAALAYTTSAAVTSDVISLDLTNAATTAQAIVVTGQAAAHTVALVDITNNSTSTGSALHINQSNTAASIGLLIDAEAAATGDMIAVNMASLGNGADGIVIYGSVVGRTGDMLRLVDDATTGVGDSIEIQSTAAKQGKHLLINVDGIATGSVVHLDIDGAATGPLVDIDLDATGSGVVFDVDIATGVWTGDIFNFNTSQAYAGDVFDIVLTNCAAGVQALVITGSATTRTAKLIEIVEAGTPSGATIDVSHGGASTCDVIHIDQTTAVASRALNLDGAGTRTVNLIDIDTTGSDTASCIDITTTAVGASGVPAALNIATTGILVAGADSVRIASTGNQSSTSSTLRVTHATGTASTQGVVYIAAKTAGDLALKVDVGTVTIDETLLVSSTTTLTGLATLTAGIDAKVILAGNEQIAAAGTTTALDIAKTVHNIDADAGGDIFTLANGTQGQIMIITCLSATGVCTITPTTLAGGTSVTLNADGESVWLVYDQASWYIMGGNAYTVV